MAIEWGRKLPRQDDVPCRNCNGLFPQRRSSQVFCSTECRIEWHYRKDLKQRREKPKLKPSDRTKTWMSEEWVEMNGANPYMYSPTIDKQALDAVSDHERVEDESAEVLALVNGSQLVWAHRIDHQHPDDPYLRLDVLLEARKVPADAQRIRRYIGNAGRAPNRKDTDGGA